MQTESQVKFRSPQNLSGASQHDSLAAFLMLWDPKLIRKDIIYTLFQSESSL